MADELFSKEPQPPADGGISCQQAQRQIERLILDSDLKDVERAMLMAHVRACAECKRALENFRKLEVRLKENLAAIDTPPNFNERLMSALPASGSAQSPAWAKVWRATDASKPLSSRKTAESGSVISLPQRRSILRSYWIGWAMVALVAIGLVGAWLHHGFGRGAESDALPLVSELRGNGVHIRNDGKQQALKRFSLLRSNDAIASVDELVEIQLSSGPNVVGNITLAPHTKLAALNRHHYRLSEGKAYFQVRKDRPKASDKEYFEIDVAGLTTVRVTGTSFCVDASAVTRGGPVVVVEEGTVEVGKGTQFVPVSGGQQIDIVNGNSAVIANVKSALAWMQPAAVVANKAPHAPPQLPVAKTPPTPAVRPALNWDKSVAGIFFAGKSLPEGIEVLAEAIGKPQQFLDILEEVRGPVVSPDCRLSFCVYNQMPLRSVLSWMARDVGGTIDFASDGAAHFRLNAASKPIGPPASGVIPDEVRKILDAPLEDNFVGIDSLTRLADRLSARSQLLVIIDRPLRDKYMSLARLPEFNLAGETVMQKVDALLAALRCNCAWYDNALYIASPSRIEALTLIDRSAALHPQLIGNPVNPKWAQSLRDIVQRQSYPAEHLSIHSTAGAAQVFSDNLLAGKPAFLELTIEAGRREGTALRYRSGVLGEALMNSILSALQTESPQVPNLVALLSPRQIERGTVPGIQTLIQQARDIFPAVDCRVKCPPFSNQAFVNKTLQLGEALEWAAWLSGFGVRQENNVLIVDEAFASYGAPSLQVVSLAHLVQRCPELAQELPQAFAQLLPVLYPTFFANADLRTLGGHIAFTGDMRQLQLAQRVRTALELALETPNATVNLHDWRPKWRADLDKNLAESFKFADAKLSGNFAGILRQSALASQLRCTVLVDPALMREHGSDAVEMDAANKTLRQVLESLAQKAGARVLLEGEIVWIKP